MTAASPDSRIKILRWKAVGPLLVLFVIAVIRNKPAPLSNAEKAQKASDVTTAYYTQCRTAGGHSDQECRDLAHYQAALYFAQNPDELK